MKLYDSLKREIRDFEPRIEGKVSMYTCGPTVYDYQHIGNLRTSTLMDTLRRALIYIGYDVKSVMNVTDVEDKIENRAKRDNVKVDDITKQFEEIYFQNLGSMNIQVDIVPHASEHIQEQIQIIQKLIGEGYAYQNEFGIYFDISKDSDYGKLGNTFKSNREQSRIGFTEGKRNQEDFALWKFPIENEERQKLWESPWGVGFPGWHIECSAMSMKTLSDAFDNAIFEPTRFETIDIHVGGDDLKEVHHENEIAQTESATGKQFVNFWVHGAMLNIGAEKMSKSLGNFSTLKTVTDQGYDPIHLRYLYYNTHYRKNLTFTYESLDAARTAYQRLIENLRNLSSQIQNIPTPAFVVDEESRRRFKEALEDDLNMPQALSVLWDVAKNAELTADVKLTTILDFDRALGLKLEEKMSEPVEYSEEVQKLIAERETARSEKNWSRADEIRDILKNEHGVEVKDRN
jgi:cysteinyl-tRNA synthetase